MHLLHIASVLSSVHLALAWRTYIVPHSPENDDTPALAAAFSADPTLATNATILFARGVTYNILTPIRFPRFENVIVSIQGNLSYAANMQTTQAIVESSSFPGSWFTFTGGSNVTLEGSTDPQWGWVMSYGQQWWNVVEGQAEQVNPPHGWAFSNIVNGEIKYMKLWQPVAWSFSTSGSKNLHVHNNKIVAVSENSAFPFETVAFLVQGEDMLFEDNVIFNGDDCLAVGNQARNIHFRNSYCNGGHGLSIGPLGKLGEVANVQNVLIENVVVENSLYGARFKSWTGGNGIARNITWNNITVNKVRMPIFITQSYWDENLGQQPNPTTANNTLIDTFTFQDLHGTIDDNANYHEGSCESDPCWYYVKGATGREVAILDLYKAKAIVAKDIKVSTLSGAPVTVMCNSTEISTDVGFKCWDGLFEPTAAGE